MPVIHTQDSDMTLWQGDSLETLRTLPDESVDCVITSPPYWGLRDYGTGEGQMGLEPTPDEYVTRMVELFREVRRVLAPHGTCWVNIGDNYNSNQGAGFNGQVRQDHANRHTVMKRTGFKPKDLVGIPWRIAFALQQDGWWLRADIIWAKPNPMPESVTDRPTKSHEYIFMLTKQPRYWFDQEAVRERYIGGIDPRGFRHDNYVHDQHKPKSREGDPVEVHPSDSRAESQAGLNGPGGSPTSPSRRVSGGMYGGYSSGHARPHSTGRGPDGRRITHVGGKEGSHQHRDGERWPNPSGRNVRSVWEIATQPFPQAHFATFPEELVRRCLLAGCPQWVCRVCGKPRERIVDVSYEKGYRSGHLGRGRSDAANGPADLSTYPALDKRVQTVGWSDCGHNNYRPGLVLDPFVGSGTVPLVARKHGRHSIGIDLNPAYLDMAAERTQQLALEVTA